MREYDNETLQRVKRLELMILADFQQFCDAHDLCWFGAFGTGIGALRHGGFIPWDDDIDVGMPRKDFTRFVQLASKELSDKYIVLSSDLDPNFPLMTAHLVLKGTKFRMNSLKHAKCDFGIFLDIYAYDQASDDDALLRKQCHSAFFWSKLMILRSVPFPDLQFRGWKAKLAHAATGIVYAGMAVCHISKPWLIRKTREACTRYNHLPETKRLNAFCDITAEQNLCNRTDVFPLKPLPFEQLTIPFPNNMDAILRHTYGDYMQLPPEEKRRNHCPDVLDFGPYANM